MIIQIGTEVDESRILWKYKESDEWKRADIDDLIYAYENRPTGEWVEVSHEVFLPRDCFGNCIDPTYNEKITALLNSGGIVVSVNMKQVEIQSRMITSALIVALT